MQPGVLLRDGAIGILKALSEFRKKGESGIYTHCKPWISSRGWLLHPVVVYWIVASAIGSECNGGLPKLTEMSYQELSQSLGHIQHCPCYLGSVLVGACQVLNQRDSAVGTVQSSVG